MTTINWKLKSALVERFGSQVTAAKALGIPENRVSYLVRGHTEPTNREREALERALGRATARRLLKSNPPEETRFADEEREGKQ